MPDAPFTEPRFSNDTEPRLSDDSWGLLLVPVLSCLALVVSALFWL
jgi:hypothetical protein